MQRIKNKVLSQNPSNKHCNKQVTRNLKVLKDVTKRKRARAYEISESTESSDEGSVAKKKTKRRAIPSNVENDKAKNGIWFIDVVNDHDILQIDNATNDLRNIDLEKNKYDAQTQRSISSYE